jgi:hypothetical protein
MVVGALLFSVIFFLLYPWPLFRAMGGSELAVLVLCVDIVLGPLLTLAVFRSGKRGMSFDLAVIAVLQLSALTYGASVVWLSRPVFIVAKNDIAYVMAATEIEAADLQRGQIDEFRQLPLWGPRLARLPQLTDAGERKRILDLNLSTGKDIQQLPEFYRRWDALPASELFAKAELLSELSKSTAKLKAEIDAWSASSGRAPDTVRCLPVLTFHEELCLAIDATSGGYLGIIDVHPGEH